MPFEPSITAADGLPPEPPGYHLGRWAARFLSRNPLGRLQLLETVGLLTRAIAEAPELPHPATVRLWIRGMRVLGFSAARLGRRFNVSARAIRLWSSGDRLPRSKTALRHLKAFASARLRDFGQPTEGPAVTYTWDRPFPPASMAGLLELHLRGVEKMDDRKAAIVLADVVEASAQLWPSSRGLLASDARTGYLSSVRQAVAAVAIAREISGAEVAQAIGRSRSTASYLATQGART